MDMKDIDSVNHVGLIVHDIEQAIQTYKNLGFSFTPVSMHSGPKEQGGPIVPYASGNVTVMFPKNYLELCANIDPTQYKEFDVEGYLEKFEGNHIICLGSRDAASLDKRLMDEGFRTSGVVELRRDVGTPDGMKTARFSCVRLEEDDTPEGLIQAAYHHNPEYIHQERYLDHPNQVVGISDVLICTNNLKEYVKRYEKLTGYSSESHGKLHVIQLPYWKITIFSEKDAEYLFPKVSVPAVPSIVGVGYVTKDMNKVRTVLNENSISYTEQDNKIFVPSDFACGSYTVFEQQSKRLSYSL